jgi:glycosyltransferase involved in cell wall biosynthesis
MVVYNGVNSSLVKSMAMKNRHLTVWLKQLKERGFSCLVFPGRLESRSKGQDVMILAMKKLIDAKVKVCATFTFGPGGERDLQKLQELVRSLGIRHRVFFRQLGPGEQYAYMAEADVIVTHLVQEHTSFEGISQVHLEAGALGKPLVAINSRDMRIFRGLPFLLSSSDPSEVAAKVEYILEHRHEANNRAEGMALIVENEFVWPHVASKYLQIYNDARNANS